jgi:hypothetical protein
LNIYQEGRGESDKGQQLIVQVTVNRAWNRHQGMDELEGPAQKTAQTAL